MEQEYRGIKLVYPLGSFELEEVQKYADEGIEKYGDELIAMAVYIEDDPDFVKLRYELKQPPFERVRRITGYLVGTLDRWNDAKQAEEHDRVKHNS